MTTPQKNECIASSFADPADIVGFKRAKARGLTDVQAFAYGDNGIGCWGDDTTAAKPMVALPPEDWKGFGPEARGKVVKIEYLNRWIFAELRDTMPARRNIKNGCGIDLNPEACKILGLNPPIRVKVKWSWHEGEAVPFVPGGNLEVRETGLIAFLGRVFGKLFGQLEGKPQGRSDQPKKSPGNRFR